MERISNFIVPVLAGPTAVGKTEVSVAVAKRLNAEIISSDSRQSFRELNIGTAKPPPNLRGGVRHHLVDELSLNEPYSAGIFARMAELRIDEILSQGNTVLVTGGSTLYLDALLNGLADIPPVAADVRASLNLRLEREGPTSLYRELLETDPDYAATLDETKTQRIVRGLEVAIGTGRTLSSYYIDARKPSYDYRLFILTRPREKLYRRIERRVDAMMSGGLLDEVKALVESASFPQAGVLRTIGYRELIEHLEGKMSLDDAVERIKRNTRRYAKRQMTWFRQYREASWIEMDEVTVPQAAEFIVRALDAPTDVTSI